VGRPWWHDSYWEKGKKQRRGFQLPRRRLWVWIAVLLLSLILSAGSGGSQTTAITWFLSFVYSLCRILTFTIFLRIILSWFQISRYSMAVRLLDDITEPILSPLRRIVPMVGMFDITPLIAFAILYAIPLILNAVLS